MPAPSRARASSGAVRFSSSHPNRILAVIGILTALTMPATRRLVLSSSVIMAEPPPTRQTLRTGQPILISTDATPAASSQAAASRISSGTDPNNWTARGWSAGQVSISFKAAPRCSNRDRALTRSVVARPMPPNSRTTSRKGRLV